MHIFKSSDPRERRRQRIRSSQSDPNSVLPRTPLLLKPPVNSKKTDHSSNVQKNNLKLDQDKGLQDSLKIFKQNIIENKIAPLVEKSSLYQDQNKIEKDPFFPRKSSSSSSSSSISSNEENDLIKRRLRDEKRERKDKRETDFLIDALTVTLKSLIGIDRGKDQIIDDFDDGDILEEIEKNPNQKQNSDYSKIPIEYLVEKNSNEMINKHPISLLGANHMYKRIRDTEEYGIKIIFGIFLNCLFYCRECELRLGRSRLEQAYKIMDSFKNEEEIKV